MKIIIKYCFKLKENFITNELNQKRVNLNFDDIKQNLFIRTYVSNSVL